MPDKQMTGGVCNRIQFFVSVIERSPPASGLLLLSPGTQMNIGLICFTSQTFAERIRAKGHTVTTVDLCPALSPGNHIIDDALHHLSLAKYDFAIMCPPCTYLTRAQYQLLQTSFARRRKAVLALEFVKALSHSNVPRWVIENPPGLASRVLGYRYDLVHPFHFGDPYRKELCLWLKDVPPLMRTMSSAVRKSISNHTNGRMSQDLKSHIKSSWDRYPLMQEAMIDQWLMDSS